jgi:methionyl-tRNA synthetase
VFDPGHIVKGGKKSTGSEKVSDTPEGIAYLDYETFLSVELRVGKIVDVKEHPHADKLYVVAIDDGNDENRTVCAGLKEYYSAEDMVGMNVVFVANLKPRKLRGVMSEGMMLAADDGEGQVKLVTIDGDISPGSLVR